jgi:hypothetical protein
MYGMSLGRYFNFVLYCTNPGNSCFLAYIQVLRMTVTPNTKIVYFSVNSITCCGLTGHHQADKEYEFVHSYTA